MSEPIDIVYTWVNGSDPKWLEKKKKALENYQMDTATKNGLSKGRFENHDELKYSLRSVDKYMAWVRNIFIVTDNQKPDWIDETNNKIKIVDHKEIFPSYIKKPTFNARLIEYFLHKIPNLSLKYLYFNDDFIVNQPLKKDDFFKEDNPIFYITKPNTKKEKQCLKIKGSIFIQENINKIENLFKNRDLKEHYFYKNAFDLFNLETKKISDFFYLKHIPYSFIKNDIEKIFLKYELYIKAMSNNQFRGKNDIHLSLLYLLNKKNVGYFNDNDDILFEYALGADTYNQKIEDVIEIFNPKYKFISVSQGDSYKENYVSSLLETLKIRFPQKSEFEKKYIESDSKLFSENLINYLENKNIFITQKIDQIEKTINQNYVLNNKLNKIYHSKTWKILFYYKKTTSLFKNISNFMKSFFNI